MSVNLSEQHGLIQKVETTKNWKGVARGELGYVVVVLEEVKSQFELRAVLQPGEKLQLLSPKSHGYSIRKVSTKSGLLPVGLLLGGDHEHFLVIRVVISYVAKEFTNLALQEDPLRVLRDAIISHINSFLIENPNRSRIQIRIKNLLEAFKSRQNTSLNLEITLVEIVSVPRRVLFESESELSELINEALAEIAARITGIGPITMYNELDDEYLRIQLDALQRSDWRLSQIVNLLTPSSGSFFIEYGLLGSKLNLSAPRQIGEHFKSDQLLLVERFFKYRDLITNLHIDAAIPEQVTINETFDLAVLVRSKDFPALQLVDLPQVITGEAIVRWPKDQPFISLLVRILAPDCAIHESAHRQFRLYIGKPSLTLYFNLTPYKVGEITITVEVYQENDAIGSVRVHTIVIEQPVGIIQMNIVSQPISHTRHPPNEISPQYVALAAPSADFMGNNAFTEELLHEKLRRLQRLEVVHARMGHNTPPEVLNEIEDLNNEIAILRKQLSQSQ